MYMQQAKSWYNIHHQQTTVLFLLTTIYRLINCGRNLSDFCAKLLFNPVPVMDGARVCISKLPKDDSEELDRENIILELKFMHTGWNDLRKLSDWQPIQDVQTSQIGPPKQSKWSAYIKKHCRAFKRKRVNDLAYPVQISFCIFGEVKVYDHIDSLNVNSSWK